MLTPAPVDGVTKGLGGLERRRARGVDLGVLAGTGLRPVRAERSLVENGPNPVMETVSPAARVSEMVANMAPTAVSASVLDMEEGAATCAHSSGLFILFALGRGSGTGDWLWILCVSQQAEPLAARAQAAAMVAVVARSDTR